jgi:peptidoglycan/LPS O-acetylase OafA/YrhL
MNPKICPRCGTPQQWEIWRRCLCGHDFGPPPQAAHPAQTRSETASTVPPAPPSFARLSAALLFASTGCALLLPAVSPVSHASGLPGLFVCSAFLFLPRPQVRRATKWSDWLVALGIVAAVAAIALIGLSLPRNRHDPPSPAFVILLWGVLMIVLYRRWRSLRRSLTANPHAKAA